jgi:hypothetical protein
MDRNGSQPGRFALQTAAMAGHENPSGMNAVLVVFLILSIGSGHDTPPVFSVEPRSSIIGFVAILWRSFENIFSAHI